MPQQIQFEEVDDATWNAAAPPKQGKVSPWESLVEQLANGRPMRVPIATDKELRGARIGIARRARARGWSVEFRVADGALLVKRGPEVSRTRRPRASVAATPGAEGQPRRRGRPPKQRPPEE